VLAIDSPIDVYADSLFWVHMLQHVLLMLVAPPLLLLGRPWPRVSRPLPIDVRRPLARAVLVGDMLAPVRRGRRRRADPWPGFAAFSATRSRGTCPRLADLRATARP
jgi:cytochrome c oxidase assembly factor CtaG